MWFTNLASGAGQERAFHLRVGQPDYFTELFNAGDEADAGYIVERGSFRVEDGGAEVVAGPGSLIGELALIVAMKRPSSAVALDHATVIRIARSLFQRVLESDPGAARRLRDELATRTSQLVSDVLMAGAKLST